MRFTVTNWHIRSPGDWLAMDHAYTIMVSPPLWAERADRNRPMFAANRHVVFDNVSEEEYTAVFRNLMKARLAAIKKWIADHDGVHVILLCACPDGQFCHRHLVAKLLVHLGCKQVPLSEEMSAPMEDVVVTVPLSFGWDTWIEEGDPAGTSWSGEEWHFYLPFGPKPNVSPGARVYVTYNNTLRGYAPLVRVEWIPERSCWALVRRGEAVAVTIDEPVVGFRGFRERWWDRAQERPFDAPWYNGQPEWMVPKEWERLVWNPKPTQTMNRPIPDGATHTAVLALDGIPIAGYYKHTGAWHCTKCDETFPNAGAVQDHIKSNENHIARGVHYYHEYQRQKKAEAVKS